MVDSRGTLEFMGEPMIDANANADNAADDSLSESSSARSGNFKRRAILVAVAIVSLVAAWFFGGAVLPRWWAQRLGNLIDGRLLFGSVLGLGLGFVFTALPLFVIAAGWRWRKGLNRAVLFLVFAALLALPNLATLGIVIGGGNAAHAGERILDVDGPGLRGGTLIGAILGAIVAIGFLALNGSRRRNKRKAAELKAQLDSQS